MDMNGNAHGLGVKNEVTFEVVQDYYGKVLSTSKDLKTNACTACNKPPAHVLDAIKKVPQEVKLYLTLRETGFPLF